MTAPVPTSLAEATSTSNSDNIVSPTVSPDDDALLEVDFGSIVSGGAGITVVSISTTLSNVGSWTIVQETITGGTPERDNIGCKAYAQITGSPGSGTITITLSGKSRHKLAQVAQVTGHDTSDPVAQTKTNSNESTTITVTFDNAISDAENLVTCMVHDYGNITVPTEGGDFTPLEDTTIDASNDSVLANEYDDDDADTTSDWSGLSGGSAVAIAFEYNVEPGGAGGTILPFMQQYHS